MSLGRRTSANRRNPDAGAGRNRAAPLRQARDKTARAGRGLGLLAIVACTVAAAGGAVPARAEWLLTGDAMEASGYRVLHATRSPESPGDLVNPAARENRASLLLDGKASWVIGPASDVLPPGGFTWQGFFLLAGTATLARGDIGAELVTQFADAKGAVVRLRIGLSDAGQNRVRLAVEMDGNEGRIFRRGSVDVIRDVWQHFALVYDGTPEAGAVTWYLDRQPSGKIFLGGIDDTNTLRPPGAAPFSIGGSQGPDGALERGFTGWLDEISLAAEALPRDAFRRVKDTEVARQVAFDYYEIEPETFAWDFSGRRPFATIRQEGLALGELPSRYSHSGFVVPRRGWIAARGETILHLPQGEHRFKVRTAADAVLTVDGRIVVDARQGPKSKRNELRDQEAVLISPGGAHRLGVAAMVDDASAGKTLELVVAHAVAGSETWRIVGTKADTPLTPRSWAAYRSRAARHVQAMQKELRQAALREAEPFWRRRHEVARHAAAAWPVEQPRGPGHPLDALLTAGAREEVLPGIGDAAFLRRLSLDVRGRIPTREEVRAFLADPAPEKRTRAIDRFLASDEWADGWMAFWQDALADSPSLVGARLNNSGGFRKFLYEALRANLPLDRFVTDLVLMDGDPAEGGTRGFFQAAGNDTPPAFKAQVVLKSFLGVDLKCARCHDSPTDSFTQKDLFSIAAFLNDGPLKVSEENVAAAKPGHRQTMLETSLVPGELVRPEWTMAEIAGAAPPPREVVAQPGRPRAELAAWITSAASPRFAEVMMDRLWDRYFGRTRHPDPAQHARRARVIGYLAQRFVLERYDLKAMARLLLTSAAYAAAARPADAAAAPWYQPAVRRLSAEQLVDSLFVAVGKRFEGEVLTLGAQSATAVDLPRPERAWQFTSLPNERDRPAIGMPVLQTIDDVLTTFGWTGQRSQPLLERDETITALQPLVLFNGLMSQRIVRLSDASAITELCLAEPSPSRLVEQLFLAVLSRPPTERERHAFVGIVTPGFEARRTGLPPAPVPRLATFQPEWKVHLQPEQTTLYLEAQKVVARGEPPTARLTADFRERVEDLLWALVNAPEFMFTP